MSVVVVNDHFESFVRLSAASLLSTAYLLAGNSVDAEELLQDVLVQLLPKWEKVMAADSAQAYVRRCLINRFISLKRSTPLSVPWSRSAIDDETNDPQSVAMNKDSLRWLLLALPSKQRAAIVLRYFHDSTDLDISQILGCRVATVRSLVSRGLVAMRKQALAEEQHSPNF